MAKSKLQKKHEASPNGHAPADQSGQVLAAGTNNEAGDDKLSPFLKKQKAKLLQLRDSLLDAMMGVSRDTLRARAEGSEASAFGMHQADAGSDAYDRDFALSLLSQEQDALYEIEEALKRIDGGTYGVCEMSGKPIPHARLEAIPFARYTVECQTLIEKQKKATRIRQPVTSLFGLTDDEGGDGEEEEPVSDNKE
jgi:DnaK suppressor protein